MAKNNKKVFIVYFSPAGSTGHVAKVMETSFNDLGTEVSVFDLEKKKDLSALIGSYTLRTPIKNFITTFHNLRHHYTHQNSRQEANVNSDYEKPIW